MILKFCETRLEEVNMYILAARNHLMMDLYMKAPENVDENKFLWISCGFLRIIETITSGQPDKGWYERVREDIENYKKFNIHTATKEEVGRVNEKLAKAKVINDFFESDKFLNLPEVAKASEGVLFKQTDEKKFDRTSRTLINDLFQCGIKFTQEEFITEYRTLLKSSHPAEKNIADMMIRAGYQEAFGLDFLKKFLLTSENWHGLSTKAFDRLAESVKSYGPFIPLEDKDKIRDIAINMARTSLKKFSDALYGGVIKEWENDIIEVISCADSGRINKFASWLMISMPLPLWVETKNRNFTMLTSEYFDSVIEVACLMLREEYLKKRTDSKAEEYDLWQQPVFRFLWVTGIIAVNKILLQA